MKKSSIWSVLIIIFFISNCVTVIAQKIDVYKRPIQVKRSKDFDVKHYRVTLSFDLEKKIFIGSNEVTLSPLKDGFTTCILQGVVIIILFISLNRWIVRKN
jgi:hypothetical protein